MNIDEDDTSSPRQSDTSSSVVGDTSSPRQSDTSSSVVGDTSSPRQSDTSSSVVGDTSCPPKGKKSRPSKKEKDLMKTLLMEKAKRIYEAELSGLEEPKRAQSLPLNEQQSDLCESFEFDTMSLRARKASNDIDPSIECFIRISQNKARKRAKHMAQLASLPPVPAKAICDSNRHTLVLDLDQTLINTITRHKEGCVTLSRVRAKNGKTVPIYVRLRPYVFQFLHTVKNLYEVIIFTAGRGSGPNCIIDYLDPTKQIFRHRLFREHCCYPNSDILRTKDLQILNRNMASVVLIDNDPKHILYQPNNCIPISSFFDDDDDDDLEQILPVLVDLAKVQDVRPKLIELYGLNRIFTYTENACQSYTYCKSI